MTKKTKKRVVKTIKYTLATLTALGLVAVFVVTGALESDTITVGTYLLTSAIALAISGVSLKLYHEIFE